jgi:hypothetical protein
MMIAKCTVQILHIKIGPECFAYFAYYHDFAYLAYWYNQQYVQRNCMFCILLYILFY